MMLIIITPQGYRVADMLPYFSNIEVVFYYQEGSIGPPIFGIARMTDVKLIADSDRFMRNVGVAEMNAGAFFLEGHWTICPVDHPAIQEFIRLENRPTLRRNGFDGYRAWSPEEVRPMRETR